MRKIITKTLFCLSFLLVQINGERAKVWDKTTIENETSINTVLTFKGTLFIGGANGVYRGEKAFLGMAEGRGGYPDYHWAIKKIESQGEQTYDSHITNVTSMSIDNEGWLDVVCDSGLYSIALEGICPFDVEKNWEKESIFTSKEIKVGGNGIDDIYILSEKRLYTYSNDSGWYQIPSYVNDGGPELDVLDFAVNGNDIVIKTMSMAETPSVSYDLYVSNNKGGQWLQGPTSLKNIFDFTAYRASWSDDFPDIACIANSSYNGQTNVHFYEDCGQGEWGGPSKDVVKTVEGTTAALAMSRHSWSEFPRFYMVNSKGYYTFESDYEVKKVDDSELHKSHSLFVSPIDEKELISYGGSELYTYVRWIGTIPVLHESNENLHKTLVAIKGDQLVLGDEVTSLRIYNTRGQMMLSQSSGDIGQRVDIRPLAKGHYIAKVQTDNGVKTVSFKR